MVWVRLDDHFDEHDKFVAAGPQAGWVFVRALAYCNRQETDGHVPASILSRIGSDYGPTTRKKLAAKLVEVGLLHLPGHECSRCPQPPEGWQVHDYTDYQPSKAKKDAERVEAAARMARARAAKKGTPPEHPDGSDHVCTEHGENNTRSSVNPVPDPVPEVLPPPLPPASGGPVDKSGRPSRADGTNPRAVAAAAKAHDNALAGARSFGLSRRSLSEDSARDAIFVQYQHEPELRLAAWHSYLGVEGGGA